MYEKKIAELIRSIANPRGDATSFPVMMGKVVAGSVDEDELVCDVVLSGDEDDCPTLGIMLNSTQGNNMGVTLIPANDSIVWVAELDGPGKWGIVKCGELVKMMVTIGGSTFTILDDKIVLKNGSSTTTIKDGEILLNDGSLGGLIKITALVTKLNNLENDNTQFKTMLQTVLAAIAALASPPAGTSPVLGSALAALFVALNPYPTATLTPTVRNDLENTNVKHA